MICEINWIYLIYTLLGIFKNCFFFLIQLDWVLSNIRVFFVVKKTVLQVISEIFWKNVEILIFHLFDLLFFTFCLVIPLFLVKKSQALSDTASGFAISGKKKTRICLNRKKIFSYRYGVVSANPPRLLFHELHAVPWIKYPEIA